MPKKTLFERGRDLLRTTFYPSAKAEAAAANSAAAAKEYDVAADATKVAAKDAAKAAFDMADTAVTSIKAMIADVRQSQTKIDTALEHAYSTAGNYNQLSEITTLATTLATTVHELRTQAAAVIHAADAAKIAYDAAIQSNDVDVVIAATQAVYEAANKAMNAYNDTANQTAPEAAKRADELADRIVSHYFDAADALADHQPTIKSIADLKVANKISEAETAFLELKDSFASSHPDLPDKAIVNALRDTISIAVAITAADAAKDAHNNLALAKARVTAAYNMAEVAIPSAASNAMNKLLTAYATLDANPHPCKARAQAFRDIRIQTQTVRANSHSTKVNTALTAIETARTEVGNLSRSSKAADEAASKAATKIIPAQDAHDVMTTRLKKTARTYVAPHKPVATKIKKVRAKVGFSEIDKVKFFDKAEAPNTVASAEIKLEASTQAFREQHAKVMQEIKKAPNPSSSKPDNPDHEVDDEVRPNGPS